MAHHSLHPRKDKAYLTHWGKSEGAVEDKKKKLVFNIFCMFCFFLQFNSNTDVGVSESRGAELSLIWYEFIFFFCDIWDKVTNWDDLSTYDGSTYFTVVRVMRI